MNNPLANPSRRWIFWFKFLVIFLTIGQRLVIKVSGFQVPIVLILLYITLVIFTIDRRVKISLTKLSLFTLAIGILALSALAANSNYPPYSLFYLILIYLPFIFIYKGSEDLYIPVLSFYQKVMVFITCLGIVQFTLPFVGIPYNDIWGYLPSSIVATGYNTYYPIEYGSPIYKSNGMVLLEPSFFSQFLAMAIILEALYFKKIWRIALYLTGIIISFSGTGLLLLGVFLIIYILKQGWKTKLFVIGTMCLLFFALKDTYYAQVLIGRVGEFSMHSNSSANFRFISPYVAIENVGMLSKDVYLFGLGPGMADRASIPYISADTNYPVLSKLIIEYGVISCFAFLVFVLHCFYTGARSKTLFVAIFMMYALLSGSLLQPQTVYFLFILFCFTSKLEQSDQNQNSTFEKYAVWR
ncbi:hypothetical protein ABE402_00835 [Bacillus smithii]|uniref:hypothetical protein n=1 Tax=Bacillus smithii TaxID=1479 RepID=UPI003D1CE1E3